MTGLQITEPTWLIVISALAIPALWFGQRRSIAGMRPAQRRACLISRSFLLLLLALGLGDVRMLLDSKRLAVVYLVDRSASISPSASGKAKEFVFESLKTQHRGDLAAVVGFAGKAHIWQPLRERLQITDEWPALEDINSTDLQHALEFASAVLPADGARRIVLLSDGNDTGGYAMQAAAHLASSGIELWTLPLGDTAGPEVLVERVDVPRRLKLGEPFDLHATIRSTIATTAQVKLYQNQFLIQERSMELRAGTNDFVAPSLQPEGSFVAYDVEVIPEADTAVENNRATATVSLRGQPRVLLVDSDEKQTRALANALRTEHINVETRGAGGPPESLEDLQQFDIFLLSDVPALRLKHEQMDLYRRWVQDFGGGFVMLGGENSFGVGGYYRTPIEELLPVRMEHEDRMDTPSVALLVVLDRSGSMIAQVQGQTKMSLANQGAAFAMNALQPKDHFGVLAVDTRAHTVLPLAPLSDKGPAEQKIMSVVAGGGGIYIYTSLAEALQQLRDIQARIKHVILFSDAADAEEKAAGETGDGAPGGGSALDLASAMLAAKITTSVVALGTEQDKDTTFLRQLAEHGNGRFYLTSDPAMLPQIFSTETMKVAQSSLVEEPFASVPAGRNPIITGIDWAQSPLLLGYNATKLKPTAERVLITERGDPLLSVWRYGLGQSAAFTSDAKSRWGADWLQWPGYGKFWAQIVRGIMRRTAQSAFQVTTEEVGDRLQILVEAVTPMGGFYNQLPVYIAARKPTGEAISAEARQEAPGSYRAEIELPDQGTTILSITSPNLPDGGAVLGHTRSYPREFLSLGVNEKLLRGLAGKLTQRFAPAPIDIFTRPTQSEPVRRDLTDWFLIGALCLLPVDIWLRRRRWQ